MKRNYFMTMALLFVAFGSAQNVAFADGILKSKLLAITASSQKAKDLNGNWIQIDANNDTEIQVSEALRVAHLDLDGYHSEDKIVNLTGVNHFRNVNWLDLSFNALSGRQDFTALVSLKDLNLQENAISSIGITGLNNLEVLNISGNQMTGLFDFSGFTNLKKIMCGGNQLTGLNLNGLMNLERLDFAGNLIQNIDLSGLVKVKLLYCGNNLFTNIDVSDLKNLEEVSCANSNVRVLDLTYSSKLRQVYCFSNANMEMLFIKGKPDVSFYIPENPTLKYFCVNDSSIAQAQYFIDVFGYNCVVNSYCSFNEGGTFHTVRGQTKFDVQNDGCDANDPIIPSVKFNITNASFSATHIFNIDGSYEIPLPNGTYIITPVLENPDFFEVSSHSIEVSFPSDGDQYLQDFCVKAKECYREEGKRTNCPQDLEIIILPLGLARPGFDANYKIIYKNKGNNTVSGHIDFEFPDAVIDFISAVPQVNNQFPNRLQFNYLELHPFESREIFVTFNINSPLEIPAVNAGTNLDFMTIVYPLENDVDPLDNHFTLNQTVVNSFDPNDKTCLEGTTITPDMVGKYVHYKIRFENTGTANAENIVVKDIIDTTKFDISSLIPMNASHSFVTKISNGNTAEFIFENINLPFDDANNDGYVVFKIKTKPTLVLGDSFSNSASIYFDYNFPIVTEPAVTTIAILGTKDFEFSDYFTLHPNPANEILNIESKKEIKISSVSIYNVLGQLVLVNTNFNPSKSIDVSGLKSGNYFIKIYSDNGISNEKFIKQ